MSPEAFLTAVAVGVVGVLWLVWERSPHPLVLNAPIVAHLAGLLAGYGVTVMLAMMSRAPALERGIGADRLARWHSKGGRTIVLLVLVHAVAATLSWAPTRQINLLSALVDVLGVPGLLTATLGTVLLLGVGAASARAARRRVSYERWHALHLGTYVAVALSFSHQLAGPDIAGNRVVQVLWSLLYTGVFALVLRYRLLTPLLQLFRHRLQVVAVVPEATGVVSIVLRGRHVHEMDAQPGQFLRWRFLTPHTWASAHPFSLSAAPSGDFLRITVKALGAGSTRLHQLRSGTRVLAEGPYGAMTARRRTRAHVLLVAGGIGITPMRALFESIDCRGENLTLLYRASSPTDVVFGRELEEIATRRGARIIYLLGSSKDPRNAVTGPALQRLVPGLTEYDVYLCAAPGLASAVRAGLRQAGLPRRQLHDEDFAF